MSAYTPRCVFVCPSGQLRCAVRHTSLAQPLHLPQGNFVLCPQADNEVDSKLSNEVLALLVTKLCPADINEKSKSEDLDFCVYSSK